MHAKSITSLALGGQTSPEVSKGFVGAYDGADYQLPKSWFNDPFALLDSMGLGYKAAPSTLSYETLRAMSEKNVVVSAIIQTRINQVAAFTRPQRNKFGIGFKIVPRDRKRKIRESEWEYIAKLEHFVLNMGVDRNPDRDSFETFTKKIIRDRLRYDQVNAEKVPRRNGKIHSVIAVPADTIRLAAPKTKKGTPLTPREASVVPKYVQVVDGTIVNEYTRKEMIFRVANPRTEIQAYGYGYSELEMLINTITAHLWAEEWNRKVFSQGATVKGILNVKGNIAPNQLDAFRRQWLTQVSGVTNAWRTPVMNSEELQWIPLQPSNNEMGYEGWMNYLIKVSCGIFLMDPAEINFDLRASVGQQPMFMTSNEAQQKTSKDRGLQPLVRFLQTVVNEDILWEIDDRYEFEPLGLDAKTEEQAVELRMKELQSYKTLNDIRREADDLPPVPGGDVVLNPVYVGLLQAQQQVKMQKDAAAQQAQQGGAGGAPGGGQQPALGQPGGAQEVFPDLFGKKGASSGDEQKLGNKIAQDAGISAPKKEKDDEESHSVEEVEEPWESTIHASLSEDLKKAMEAFEILE